MQSLQMNDFASFKPLVSLTTQDNLVRLLYGTDYMTQRCLYLVDDNISELTNV